MMASTIFELLADQPKDAVAIHALGRHPLVFSALRDQIVATIETLNRSGVGRNDRVAVVLPNGPEMALACLAISSGATCVPLNPEFKANEFAHFLSTLGVKLLVVQMGVGSPARDVAHLLEIPVFELQPLGEAEAGCFELFAADDTVARPTATPDCGPALTEDIALVLHTSGTTSVPKIVPLCHANLIASSANLCESLALESRDRVLNMMPLFHIGGLVDLLLAPLSVGASSICTQNFSLPGFAKCIEVFDPSIFQVVPTMLREIFASGKDTQRVIRESSLRLIRSVSASLPEGLRIQIESACEIPIVEIYGMTESSGLITSNPPPPGLRKPGSVGVAVGSEVAILSAKGARAVANERGEVAVRGPSVMEGYESDPDANSKTFTDGFLRTGDQGYLDPEGYLYLTGRIKEIINRGGEKISPREVDDVLELHPEISEAATFPVPHASLGEDVAAAVVLCEGAQLSKESLLEFLRSRLAYFKVPRSVQFVAEIPKSRGGKLQRYQLAELLRQADTDEATEEQSYVAPESLLAVTIASIWKDILGVEQVGLHDDFFYLGGDSIAAASFVNELQQRWNEIVYVSAVFDAPTLSAFAGLLEAQYRGLVLKILGYGTGGVSDEDVERVDAGTIEHFRSGIVFTGGEQKVQEGEKNRSAIFILSPPRSGSTLLRAMLGGHSRLFAPPELYLLSFDDLAARRAWLDRSQSFMGEGNLRALMQLRDRSLAEAEQLMAGFESRHMPTRDYFRLLQDQIEGRILVEKTPFNAAHQQTLARAEAYFEDPLYIHLIRHPYGMIRSFEEARLAPLWYPRLFANAAANGQAMPYAPRTFAELIWLELNRNILAFLETIPGRRKHVLRFEDLVAAPQRTTEELSLFLGLEFQPAMLEPHGDKKIRMTDGIHRESRMIGDMKFHQHKSIDAKAASLWKRHYTEDFLSDEAWSLAESFGYRDRIAEKNDREEFEF